MRTLAALARNALIGAALIVVGCSSPSADDSPQGLTEGERDRLESAAERLEARPAAPGADDAAALQAETRDRLAVEQSQRGAAER